MNDSTKDIDQMLDLYNDCLRVLSKLPDIPPGISADMCEDLLAMDPAIRVQEMEWLKAHLAQVIATMAKGQQILDQARELLGEEEFRKLMEEGNHPQDQRPEGA